jgi:hypothetical protein
MASKLTDLIAAYLNNEKFITSSKRARVALALADYVAAHQTLWKQRDEVCRHIIEMHKVGGNYDAAIDFLQQILNQEESS